jgi:hypothetical protein
LGIFLIKPLDQWEILLYREVPGILKFPNRSLGPLPSLLLPRARAALLCFPLPPAQYLAPGCRSTSCWDDPHASSSPYPGSVPLPCCPPPRTPRPPELTADRHAPRRRCLLLLAPTASLLALTHAQRPLSDLVHSFPHFFSTAFFIPELSSSPDFRRHAWLPSTAAAVIAQLRSNTPIAPQRPTGACQPIQFHPPASEPCLPQRQPARAPPPPSAHHGQAASANPTPRQPLSQFPCDPVKLCNPSIDPLVHHIGSSTCAGHLQPPPLSLTVDTPPQSPSASTRGISSTTSSNRSFSAVPPPPSGIPATGTTSLPSLPSPVSLCLCRTLSSDPPRPQ